MKEVFYTKKEIKELLRETEGFIKDFNLPDSDEYWFADHTKAIGINWGNDKNYTNIYIPLEDGEYLEVWGATLGSYECTWQEAGKLISKHFKKRQKGK